MRQVPIPRYLRESCARDPEPGRDAWVAALPATIERIAAAWQLDVGAPMEPGGQCSWVAAVRAEGAELVLKVGWRHPEAEHEAAGLECWDGKGTVRLHRAWAFDDTSALLLERCRPGDALATRLPPVETDVVVAGLLQRLWAVPPPPDTFRPLSEMCRQWMDGFERRRAASTQPQLPAELVELGTSLFLALPQSAEREVLLCTDLHAENVLAAEREPWLAIDPKPYVGDPTYDALQHMLNQDRLVEDPVGLANRMAELLDLDPTRLLQWLFARCVIESVDEPQTQSVARKVFAAL